MNKYLGELSAASVCMQSAEFGSFIYHLVFVKNFETERHLNESNVLIITL